MTSRKIEVLIGDRASRVGTLFFESRGGGREASSFRYDQAWLGNKNAFGLSPLMPLVDAPFHASRRPGDDLHARALPGPIADAAPDAWGQRILRSDAGQRSPLTDIDYLLLVDDATRMGALRFADESGEIQRPRAAGKPIAPASIELGDLQRAAHAFERKDGTAADLMRLVAPGSSLGGARPKASVTDATGRLFIAKFTSALDTNDAVERAEVATLRLAQRAGLNVPRTEITQVNRFAVALIERFDRVPDGRLHYASAQSFLGLTSADDGSYGDIAEAIRANCGDVGDNLTELYRRLMFNILVSNTDDHLKNHGFLLAANARWNLAPAFDVNPQPERARQLKTSITPGGSYEASVAAAIDAARQFDLTKDEGSAIARAMASTIRDEWRPICRAAGMGEPDLRYYAAAFEHDEARFACGLGQTAIQPSSYRP